MNIADAKTALPFPALLGRLGIEAPDRDQFKIKCPVHNEKNGESFSAQRKNGTWLWNCFGKCNCGGDEIDFLAALKSVSREDAIKLYLEMAGSGKKPVPTVSSQKKRTRLPVKAPEQGAPVPDTRANRRSTGTHAWTLPRTKS